jgi:hypothetical protein
MWCTALDDIFFQGVQKLLITRDIIDISHLSKNRTAAIEPLSIAEMSA